MIKIDKNLTYALYVLGALVGGFAVVKIVKAIKDNADKDNGGSDDEEIPKPETPNIPIKEGLNAQQTKQEELQSLLGFIGRDIDHIIGKNTIAKYNALNLKLGIDLNQQTSVTDLQKIIDEIKSKNKKDSLSVTAINTRTRAREMVQAWPNNPTGVLVALKPTKLFVVNLDKTTNKYVAINKSYTYTSSNKFTRQDLGVLSQAIGFKAPYYIIFKNSLGSTFLANPNDWIIK